MMFNQYAQSNDAMSNVSTVGIEKITNNADDNAMADDDAQLRTLLINADDASNKEE